jgi:hypothetical protein
MGLEVNGERGEKRQNDSVKLGTYNFEIVKDYAYFGTILTNKNELRPEIENRITHAKRAYYTLLPLLKEPVITQSRKYNNL